MNIDIRKYFEETDYEKILDCVKKENWQSFYEERINEYRKALKESLTYVIYVDDCYVGYIRALTDGFFTLFIAEIVILEEYRRLGYGKELIAFVHNLYPSTRIDLLSDNDDFYVSQGFRVVGSGMRKHNWY